MAHGSEYSGHGSAGGSAGASGVGGTAASASTGPPSAATAAALPLESLTPSFDEKQHGTYLRRLEEAIADPRNRNIALTGRYGAGKSSVLDKFEANHAESALRLAISTLAPGEEGETTTNRIQKEIVKQLLYGANEKVGKNSRFTKIAVLTKRTAVLQSAGIVLCLGGLLYLLGWLPDIKWTGDDQQTWVRVVAWAGAAVLATLVVSVVRMLTYGRRVSDVSAGPAALTLDENPDSYFDKFLDEIVHYFGRESKDIVIFEDLDRFEDPGIFEALRELNLLLNETPERRRRRAGNRLGHGLRSVLGRISQDLTGKVAAKVPDRWAARILGTGFPLRFVYALRDSVFEKIDAEAAAAAAESGQRIDAAAAETLRANRTKFFDIVISLVPFISHRNARDLLLKLLATRGITGIELRLVNTIAKHCTDMRLMRNICNEYLVFAERLLEPEAPNKPAPGMDASHLFGLVAYKNFHLEDFENITRRDGDLDRLYELHQRMVRETIAAKDERKRALIEEPGRFRVRAPLAERLGKRLDLYGSPVRQAHSTQYQNWPYYRFRVGTGDFEPEKVTGYAFWSSVAVTRSVGVILTMQAGGGGQTSVAVTLDEDALAMFVPECLDANRWAAYDAEAVRTELDGIERDIERLRRADFADLVAMPAFTLQPTVAGSPVHAAAQTFPQLLEATLKSELACDLVRRGYIDRNFSLYAAQFYGNFTGVDVANFMVQHVQTNTMAVDYDLSREGAVANLLTETEDAGEGLEHTVAAYNIDIVNHLLTHDDPRADAVVDNLLASGPDQSASTFLSAYFTSANSERVKLAALLAEHRWREVFAYLVGDEQVPADARVDLVSAAICAFDPDAAYDLGDDVREFITTNYRAMPAFTDPHTVDATVSPAGRVPERVDVLLDRAGVIVPDLAKVLDRRLHDLIVAGKRYQITADNLRSALDVTSSVSLDEVQNNETVYAYCLDEPVTYLAAVTQDPSTGHTLYTPQTLVKVLNDVPGRWDEDEDAEPTADNLADLLDHASSDARLRSLRDVPKSTWTAVAAAGLFRASLANVEDYRGHVGSIDDHLASLLERAGTVHVDGPGDVTDTGGDEYDRQGAAIGILNATQLAQPVRVDLAVSVGASKPLPVDDITARPDDLFALLLERGMVADDETSFTHFRQGGWAALGPAIKVSNDIETFLKPDLVLGMVAELLTDPATAERVGKLTAFDVEEYVPDDDWTELKALARYADTQRIALAPDTVVRIARVAHENSDVDKKALLRTLVAANPAASADHIIAVFEYLGPDYDKIRQTDEKLKFDRDDTHERLLKVLQDANVVSRGRTGRQHYSATVM